MGLVVCMWEKAMKNGGISFSHLAGSREYTDHLNIAESWFDNDNQNTDLENDLGGSKNATVSKKGEWLRNHWTVY